MQMRKRHTSKILVKRKSIFLKRVKQPTPGGKGSIIKAINMFNETGESSSKFTSVQNNKMKSMHSPSVSDGSKEEDRDEIRLRILLQQKKMGSFKEKQSLDGSITSVSKI